MYEFVNQKNSATFNNLKWNNDKITFTLNAATKGHGQMTVMLPDSYMGRSLKSFKINGKSVLFTVKIIKGIQYAMINTLSGTYDYIAQYSKPVRTTYGNNGKPWPIPGRIECENYDEGIPGDSTYYDTTKGSEAPADEYYRSGDVDLGVDPLLSLIDVGWVHENEWLEYTVEVSKTGTYKALVCIATPLNNIKFGPIEFDGAQKIGFVNIPNTGDWGSDLKGGHKFQEVDCGSIQLTRGIHKMRVHMGKAGFTVNWVKFE